MTNSKEEIIKALKDLQFKIFVDRLDEQITATLEPYIKPHIDQIHVDYIGACYAIKLSRNYKTRQILSSHFFPIMDGETAPIFKQRFFDRYKIISK
jgi:hypothetical protein